MKRATSEKGMRRYAVYAVYCVSGTNKGQRRRYVAVVEATNATEAARKTLGAQVFRNARVRAGAWSRLSEKDKKRALEAEYVRQRCLESLRAWLGRA